MAQDIATPLAPLRATNIGDRAYELYIRSCACCGRDHAEIWRWSGISFARYKMPADFHEADFEDFIVSIDTQLLVSSSDFLDEFRLRLDEINSPEGIEAESTYEFRLLEYGRTRASALQRLGYMDDLTSKIEPSSEISKAIRSAFELGVAVAEHRIIEQYEHYIWRGIAADEWREEGLPKARAERLRQGKRTRNAVLEAANRLYLEDPCLIRNDSETARRILALRLESLQKSNGSQIGFDAITRILREARQSASRAA